MMRIFLIMILFLSSLLGGSMFYSFKANSITGNEVNFEKYKGQVVLVVNVASKCGFTPQYEGLERLYKQYKDQGLAILGFPSNQFGEQEPGSNEEIAQFCTLNYGVNFEMFEKIDVNGESAHPLYKYLKAQQSGFLGTSSIKWNFTKFLINKEGDVIKRFGSTTTPEEIEPEIKKLL